MADITSEVIAALTWLRNGWDGDNSVQAIQAFDTLDNAGVFAEIDQATGYNTDPVASDPPVDPAEWGDTTRADMARHQGLTQAEAVAMFDTND